VTPTVTVTPTYTITPTATATPEPLELSIKGNYPNPVRGETNIIYWLSREAEIEIKIWTVSGEEVIKRKIKGEKGMNRYYWDGRNRGGKEVAVGVYIYEIKAKTEKGEEKRKKTKMVVLR
jgi:flagellar hook assembly protein FlgD